MYLSVSGPCIIHFLIMYALTVGYPRTACFGDHIDPFHLARVELHLFSIMILTDGSRDAERVDER